MCLLFLWPWKYIKTASQCVHSWLDIPFAINFNCSTVNFSFSYMCFSLIVGDESQIEDAFLLLSSFVRRCHRTQASRLIWVFHYSAFVRTLSSYIHSVLYRKYLFINQTESNRAQKKCSTTFIQQKYLLLVCQLFYSWLEIVFCVCCEKQQQGEAQLKWLK